MATVDRESGLDAAAAVFQGVRRRLFGIAYRMLGSASEAEDLLQEVWIRWQGTDRGTVEDPGAFLATVTTRLAINALKSARVRRETYIGPWLPDPVDTAADPYLGAERGEALELASLLLMERLMPNERAAFVLREAFDYPYAQIAEVLQTGQAAARQLVSRARKHMSDVRRPRRDAEGQRELLTAFMSAARTGDMHALERLFTADVANLSDGNGGYQVARRVLEGPERVARFFAALVWLWEETDVEWTTVNGRSAVILRRGGDLYGILTVGAVDEGIDRVMWIVNPDKLSAVSSGG